MLVCSRLEFYIALGWKLVLYSVENHTVPPASRLMTTLVRSPSCVTVMPYTVRPLRSSIV